MNDKAIQEILETILLLGLETGRDGDLKKLYEEYDGDMDWVEFVRKHLPLDREVAAIQRLLLTERKDELKTLLRVVPMPSLSYEQIENRIAELDQQLKALGGER